MEYVTYVMILLFLFLGLSYIDRIRNYPVKFFSKIIESIIYGVLLYFVGMFGYIGIDVIGNIGVHFSMHDVSVISLNMIFTSMFSSNEPYRAIVSNTTMNQRNLEWWQFSILKRFTFFAVLFRSCMVALPIAVMASYIDTFSPIAFMISGMLSYTLVPYVIAYLYGTMFLKRKDFFTYESIISDIRKNSVRDVINMDIQFYEYWNKMEILRGILFGILFWIFTLLITWW